MCVRVRGTATLLICFGLRGRAWDGALLRINTLTSTQHTTQRHTAPARAYNTKHTGTHAPRHHSSLCSKGPGGTLRQTLTDNARASIDKQTENMSNWAQSYWSSNDQGSWLQDSAGNWSWTASSAQVPPAAASTSSESQDPFAQFTDEQLSAAFLARTSAPNSNNFAFNSQTLSWYQIVSSRFSSLVHCVFSFTFLRRLLLWCFSFLTLVHIIHRSISGVYQLIRRVTRNFQKWLRNAILLFNLRPVRARARVCAFLHVRE